jgi:hypothetical protein
MKILCKLFSIPSSHTLTIPVYPDIINSIKKLRIKPFYFSLSKEVLPLEENSETEFSQFEKFLADKDYSQAVTILQILM